MNDTPGPSGRLNPSYRSIGYTDNNARTQYLSVSATDKEVNAEQAAVIVTLDRIATALELIVDRLRGVNSL